MKRAAGRVLASSSVVWKKMHILSNEARAGKSFLDVIALGVDYSDRFWCVMPLFALIAFESDVVRPSADPNRLSVHLKWRFPDTQVVARRDDGNRLRVPSRSPAPAER